MKAKKMLGILFIFVIIIVLAIVVVLNYNNKITSNNSVNTQNVSQKLQENDLNTNDVTIQEDTNIILYNGIEIEPKVGVQNLSDIEINSSNNDKYNTTYYNYENGKYEGQTEGIFGEPTYEGYSIVENVKRIAMTKKYDAVLREYTKINELPKEIEDMADCSSVDINSIDLDGDGKLEYVVCYTINYTADDTENMKPVASSGIMLLDSEYKKISDLVILENGFWANIEREEYKVFLSLDDVEYIDIDNDGIMEIIIKVPMYEGTSISILKYNNNEIIGEVNLQATLGA